MTFAVPRGDLRVVPDDAGKGYWQPKPANGCAEVTCSTSLDHVGQNIRVNCVAPVVTSTSYFNKMLKQVPDPAEFQRVLNARQPMGRAGQPAEIAHAFLCLASDESSFATGSMVTVDGGATTI